MILILLTFYCLNSSMCLTLENRVPDDIWMAAILFLTYTKKYKKYAELYFFYLTSSFNLTYTHFSQIYYLDYLKVYLLNSSIVSIRTVYLSHSIFFPYCRLCNPIIIVFRHRVIKHCLIYLSAFSCQHLLSYWYYISILYNPPYSPLFVQCRL